MIGDIIHVYPPGFDGGKPMAAIIADEFPDGSITPFIFNNDGTSFHTSGTTPTKIPLLKKGDEIPDGWWAKPLTVKEDKPDVPGQVTGPKGLPGK